LLVLCPSSLRLNWKDEIFKWIHDISKAEVQSIKSGKEKLQKGIQIYIMSYDLASKKTEEIEAMNFKVAIADEAHLLKSQDVSSFS
jgi:SNF2 family DNA or RNA helicase